MSGIGNIYNSPEKQNKIKELDRLFNTAITSLNALGIAVTDTFVKDTIIPEYRVRRAAIESEHLNLEADISFKRRTRTKKEQATTPETQATPAQAITPETQATSVAQPAKAKSAADKLKEKSKNAAKQSPVNHAANGGDDGDMM